jgi:hypothetical protein
VQPACRTARPDRPAASCEAAVQVDTEGYWRWCMALRRTGFLEFHSAIGTSGRHIIGFKVKVKVILRPTVSLGVRHPSGTRDHFFFSLKFSLGSYGFTYTFQIYLRSQLRIYWCYFFLSVHNVFRPLRAIFRWNTITSLTYLEKAIDITPDPLFHNLFPIIHNLLTPKTVQYRDLQSGLPTINKEEIK